MRIYVALIYYLIPPTEWWLVKIIPDFIWICRKENELQLEAKKEEGNEMVAITIEFLKQ